MFGKLSKNSFRYPSFVIYFCFCRCFTYFLLIQMFHRNSQPMYYYSK